MFPSQIFREEGTLIKDQKRQLNRAKKIRESVGDDELILQYRQGNQGAFFILYTYYYHVITVEAEMYLLNQKKPNMYFEDLVDEATSSFKKALTTYMIGERTFTSYFKTSLMNDFRDFFKGVAKESFVSMDPDIIESQYGRFRDIDENSVINGLSVDRRLEFIYELIDKNVEKFSVDELRIIFLVHYGYSFVQVGEILDFSPQKMYRLRNKIKAKLNILMKNN